MLNYMLCQAQTQRSVHLKKFLESLEEIPDSRDNRGKEHELSFVLFGVTLAILSGRARLSSIQRYIANRIEWLREITEKAEALSVSRAQLPRILSGVDRDELNRVTMNHFGVLLIETGEDQWQAIDGKALCGTPDEAGKQKARIVTAVNHESRETVAQYEMNSAKKGEITAVRTFLHESGLEQANVTLDALHLNPKTTAQIHQSGGHYLIQVKGNQNELSEILTTVASTATPVSILNYTERGHGRQEERWYWCFEIHTVDFDERWRLSGLHTLVVVMRQTATGSDGTKISLELSYYLSNWPLSGDNAISPDALARAVRRHWGVESVNWIRDVTFQEDKVKTKDPQLAQCLATIRSFAIRLLQRAHFPNFQEAIERFIDCPDDFFAFLRQAELL